MGSFLEAASVEERREYWRRQSRKHYLHSKRRREKRLRALSEKLRAEKKKSLRAAFRLARIQIASVDSLMAELQIVLYGAPLCRCHQQPMRSAGKRGWTCHVRRLKYEASLSSEQKRERERRKRALMSPERRRERNRKRERLRRAKLREVERGPYSRAEIWERDGGLCRYCGEPAGEDWHVAHLVALASGGPDTKANVAVACAPCNLADGTGRLPVQLHINV